MPIGYIGLGIMGAAMASNLRRRGFDLVVWNRTPAKCEPLIELGATRAGSIGDLSSRCEVIFINVTDTPDVEAVLFDAGGVADSARPGTIVVDHSTIRPDRTKEFAARLLERQITLLDAPVSGGDVGARNGTLSIMVGGDGAALARVRPVLEAMGKRITHVGASGAGQLCKACNQVAVLVTLAGVCEAIALARAGGLDVSSMIEVVSAGAGGSWQLANLGPKIVAGDLKPAFMVELALKDLNIVLEMSKSMGLELDGLEIARARLRQVADEGGGTLGTQAMIRAVEPRSSD
jgi:3-hydroxyisobutyrate dehydrogenase